MTTADYTQAHPNTTAHTILTVGNLALGSGFKVENSALVGNLNSEGTPDRSGRANVVRRHLAGRSPDRRSFVGCRSLCKLRIKLI
jgi:hypothetical protein